MNEQWNRIRRNSTERAEGDEAKVKVKVPLKSELPGTAQWLIDKMRNIQFGRIEGLRIFNGLPEFEPYPRILLDRKIGFAVDTKKEADGGDFKLKSEVVDLFQQLALLGNGTVVVMEIRNGLPVWLRMEKDRQK